MRHCVEPEGGGHVEGKGLGPADLPAIYREEYLRAVEWARLRHDPASDWDEFVEDLWAALVSGLGLDVVVHDEVEHRRGLRADRDGSGVAGRLSGEVE